MNVFKFLSIHAGDSAILLIGKPVKRFMVNTAMTLMEDLMENPAELFDMKPGVVYEFPNDYGYPVQFTIKNKSEASITPKIYVLEFGDVRRATQPLPPPPPVNYIDVGIGDAYTYHTIKSAEQAANNGDIIRIHEGTYDEYGIGSADKELTYLGVDKDNCIVLNGLSDKMYSVFNLTNANKTVKNLTIHQTHSDPQNPDISEVAYKAYAIHCDAAGCAGHDYLIEDCIIKNKYFAACGFGTWQDTTITVKNCELDTYDNNRDITDVGAYYCHANTFSDNVTGQKIVLIGNTIHADQTKAIYINAATRSGSEMICEFIDNTCSSELYGTTTDCVRFGTNEHTTLTETSTGNNISTLNYGGGAQEVEPSRILDALIKTSGSISASGSYKTYEYYVTAGTYRITVNATNTALRYGSTTTQANIGDTLANVITNVYKRTAGQYHDITIDETCYLYAHITNTETLESGNYITLTQLS